MNRKKDGSCREDIAAAADGYCSRMELTKLERHEFQQMYQMGIYRELYERNMLTEYQLNELLNRLSGGCACDNEGTVL